MSKTLPAGEHNGTILRSWSSSRLFVCHICYGPESTYDEHANERASVIIVQRGRCSKRMGRQTFDLSRRSLLFIPPQDMQTDSFPVATSFLAAELSASFLERFHEIDSGVMEHVELTCQDDQDFRGRLLRELVEPDAVSELVFEGILLNMLACARRGREGRQGKPPSWLARAKELLHDRAFESVKLYEIAKAVDIHPAQLSREFGRFFKVTPGEYLRQLRIEFATKQLEETDMALVEIAGASGFADQAHFSRAFQRRMRCSPGQYRYLANSHRETL